VHASLERSARNGTLELVARRKWPAHIRLYYFFHTSLLLWNATFGHAYPHAEYLWRLEIDVLYAGARSVAALLERPMHSMHASWDVLLPDLTYRDANFSVMGAYTGEKNYPHWEIADGRHAIASPLPPQEAILAGVPHDHQLAALVSVGRYSTSFLRLMRDKWDAGIIGYEEILLPTTCQTALQCKLAPFGTKAKVGVRHIRYRPAYSCEQFLEAHIADAGELWHPVKNRSCFASWLVTHQEIQ
jgi:hypothetical protein